MVDETRPAAWRASQRGASAARITGVVGVALIAAAIAAAVVLLLLNDDPPASRTGRHTPGPTPAGDASGPASPGAGDADGDNAGADSEDDGPSSSGGGGDTGRPPARAPATLFAVGPGGIQRVDTATGDRSLVAATEVAEDAVSHPVGVDVGPRGERLAVDMCCEPVPGSTYLASAGQQPDGGLSLLRSGAIYPAIGPDGRRVAMAAGGSGHSSIVISDVAGEHVREIAAPSAAPEVGAIAWSPDGSRLAFEWGGEHAGVWVVAADATDLADAREVALDPGVVYESPAFRSDGTVVVTRSEPPAARRAEDFDELAGTSTGVVIEPASGEVQATFSYEGRVLLQDYDASGTYLVYGLSDGRVRWKGAGDTGDILPAEAQLSAPSW